MIVETAPSGQSSERGKSRSDLAS